MQQYILDTTNAATRARLASVPPTRVLQLEGHHHGGDQGIYWAHNSNGFGLTIQHQGLLVHQCHTEPAILPYHICSSPISPTSCTAAIQTRDQSSPTRSLGESW